MLNLEQKKAVVAEVAEVAAGAQAAFAAEYRGLTVAEMTQLRAEARNAGVYLRVVKNTLARRALEDTDFACMKDVLVGPLVLAFSKEDPAAAARVMERSGAHLRTEVLAGPHAELRRRARRLLLRPGEQLAAVDGEG